MKKINSEKLIALLALAAMLAVFGALLLGFNMTLVMCIGGALLAVIAAVIVACRVWYLVEKCIGKGPARFLKNCGIAMVTMCLCLVVTVYAARSNQATYKALNDQAQFLIHVQTATNDVEINPEFAEIPDGYSVKLYGYQSCAGTSYKDNAAYYTVTITNNSTHEDGTPRGVEVKVTAANAASHSATLTWADGDASAKTFVTDVASAAGKSSASTLEITFSDIKLAASTKKYTITFANDPNGSYLVDSEPAPESAVKQDTATVALSATANEGYEFACWYSANNGIVSEAANYTYTVSGDDTVRPVFKKAGSALYILKETGAPYIYLNDAITAAGNSGTVTVRQSGVAYHSDATQSSFTIPEGVTLLIPYDVTNTVIKADAEKYVYGDTGNPNKELPQTEFRSLTMPNGTAITVAKGGTISVGSQTHFFMKGQTGAYGALYMDKDSSITVESGGNLYAWGYIFGGQNGSGTVTIQNGAKVYEPLNLKDYTGDAGVLLRIYGGVYNGPYEGTWGKVTMLSDAGKNLNGGKAFPLRTFTLANVEVPMTIQHGGQGIAFVHLWGMYAGYKSEYVAFIGKAGDSKTPIFQTDAADAEITIYYAGGRQVIEINGKVTLNSMAVNVKVSDGVEGKVDSSKTSGMPFPSHYTFKINSGTATMKDNLVVCEGAQVYLAEGATLDMNGKNFYFIGEVQDPGANAGNNVHGVQFTNVPKTTTVDINGTIIASGGLYGTEDKASLISSKGTGLILSNGTKDKTDKIYMKAGVNTMHEQAVVRGYLENDNGEYVQISATAESYIHENGAWVPCEHTPNADDGDCTTAITCSRCGAVTTPAAAAHTPKADDGDCTTAITCSVCSTVTTPAAAAHTPNADDGDCTTAITCSVCGTVTTPAAAAHTPKADDGDCTTAITCSVCGTVTTPAAAAHTPKADDGDCTTAITCSVCGTVTTPAAAAHTPEDDDGNCTTAVKCKHCEQIVTAAMAAHVAGEDDGDCTTAVKCVNCEKNAVEAKNAHVAGEDDGNCLTAVKCVNCEKNAVEAKEAHVGEEDDGDCTTSIKCANCDRIVTNGKVEHVAGEDDGDCTTAIKCMNCSKDAVEANASHTAGEDDGNCLTAVKCVNCEKNAVEAKDAHIAGEDDGDCTTAVKCENCEQDAIAAKDAHVAGEDDGDCTTAVKCVNCDKNAIEAKAHTVVSHEGQPATCDEPGWKPYMTCADCAYTTKETIDALGHDFKDYIRDGNATVYQDGTKTASCANNCGKTDTVTDVGSMLPTVAKIGEKKYATLAEAVAEAQDGETVTLVIDASGAGMVIDKSITIDFGGKTYSITEPVGSAGTATNGLQILQGNTVILKNGTVNVAQSNAAEFYILIQNYANLTVTDMTLDGTYLDRYFESSGISYVLSNNCGTVNINGNTNIIANNDGNLAVAIDACKFLAYDVPNVNINTTGTVSGTVEITGGNLVVDGGTFNVAGTQCYDVFVCDSGELTINAGTVSGGSKNQSTAVWAKNTGIVNINGGTFTVGADETAVQAYNDLIYAKDNALVNISGGHFDGPARASDGVKFLLNLKDGSNAKFVVTGGTFVGFNPGDTGTEPAGTTDDFCAADYGPTDNGDGTYGVHKHQYDTEVTDPTCTVDGFTTYTCSVCDDTYEADVVPMLGHKFNDEDFVYVPASFGINAHEKAECANGCGEIEIRNEEANTQWIAKIKGADSVGYTKLDDAMAVAQPGDTVVMMANATWSGLLKNVTLDLNGHVLTVEEHFVAFNGSNVVDNSAENTGLLAIDKSLADYLILSPNNKQLPVRIAEGYIFVELVGFNTKEKANNTFVFQPLFEAAAREPLQAGKAQSQITLAIRVSWGTDETARSQDFEYVDRLVQGYMASYKPDTGKYGSQFKLVLGVQNYGDYQKEIVIRSETGVEITFNPNSAN